MLVDQVLGSASLGLNLHALKLLWICSEVTISLGSDMKPSGARNSDSNLLLPDSYRCHTQSKCLRGKTVAANARVAETWDVEAGRKRRRPYHHYYHYKNVKLIAAIMHAFQEHQQYLFYSMVITKHVSVHISLRNTITWPWIFIIFNLSLVYTITSVKNVEGVEQGF